MFYRYLLKNSPIKYHNFGVLAYDSAEKQMLRAILFVIEQRRNEFDRIVKVRFSPSMFLPCEGDITFRTPAKI